MRQINGFLMESCCVASHFNHKFISLSFRAHQKVILNPSEISSHPVHNRSDIDCDLNGAGGLPISHRYDISNRSKYLMALQRNSFFFNGEVVVCTVAYNEEIS